MDWRTFMLQWNNDNPLDRKFRQKYNIPFNSPQHREINQLDILLEYQEDQLYEDFYTKASESAEKEEAFLKGEWIKERKLDEQEEEDLFAKIDISKINANSQIKVE